MRLRLFATLGALALTLAPAGAWRTAAQQGGRVVRPQYGAFGVDVVAGGDTLEVIHGRGRRYVEAREGAEYEIVLRNPLPVRVAVALSVDGLNTIDARRTSAWESSKWVIEPYGTARVRGWQTSSTSARRFYFTTERDSYAARLGRAADLGVITAVFYREAVPPRPRPVWPPPYYEDDGVRPRGRSEASISQSPLRATRSALTVRTLRSTSRSMDSGTTPGRSNSMTNRSPSRHASIGITAGRLVVPSSCPARRSNSRNGSVVRSSMVVVLLSCSWTDM